jgi:multiple sugar transport system substrate-binding protein
MVVNERNSRAVIGRRSLLTTGIATATGLAGMGLGRRAHAQSPATLTLAVWGAQTEEDAFKAIVDKYQRLHPNVTIRLEVNGNAMQLYQLVDTRLAGRQAPDIFRIQYQQVGRYAGAGALVDLSPYLDHGYSEQFGPAFWQAVTLRDKPFALPHHTDTFALYYNVDFLRNIGVEMLAVSTRACIGRHSSRRPAS